ncbi:MAG: GNAT family N-acetyltransferase [Bacillota bacterium]|nr:GNAT family N-acetyltransferase [Bacillota bacterium]
MTPKFSIRPLEERDLDRVASLAALLWVPSKPEVNRRHFAEHIGRPEAGSTWVALAGECIIGFADCRLRRDYVEGCETSPIAYLEDIYVEPEWRGLGIAAALVRACEAWARECGSLEFASDTDLGNLSSQAFHHALGFTEAARIVHYKKRLDIS